MPDTSVIEINLAAIHHNVQVIRRIIGPDVQLCCIVKADAYGLGAVRMAKRLLASGADMLAVYTADQAAEIVSAVPSIPVVVLMPERDLEPVGDIYRGIVAGRVHLTVHGLEHFRDILEIARRFGCVIPVHVEVDTGMSRGGADVAEAGETLREISRHHRARLAGVFTHFASAERDPRETERQSKLFDEFLEAHRTLIPKSCRVHAANTAATVRCASLHQRMVRVGLLWIGYGCDLLEDDVGIEHADELVPAVTWASRIVHLKSIPEGTRIGYGGTWRAARPTRIALVPVGYADGYSVACGSDHTIHRPVHVRLSNEEGEEHEEESERSRSFFAPVVGAVNMDQITIDITDIPQRASQIGTLVEIFTPDRAALNHIPHIARQIGAPPHELLSRLSPRLRRHYHVTPVAEQIAAAH